MEFYWLIIIIYLGFNLLAFVMMGFDKWRASNGGFRVPERRFFLFSFFGGGVGIFAGMRLFRHKTQHPKFQILVPISIALNLITLFFILAYFKV